MGIPKVRDPLGWFMRENERLLEFMSGCPDLAQVFRQIAMGSDMWAGQRGVSRRDLELECRLVRGNAFLVRIRRRGG